MEASNVELTDSPINGEATFVCVVTLPYRSDDGAAARAALGDAVCIRAEVEGNHLYTEWRRAG